MHNNLDITYYVLDSIDIMAFLRNKPKNYNVIDLMNDLDKFVKSSNNILFMLWNKIYFQDELFNWMNEDEFIDYLQNRFGNELTFTTTITNYLRLNN